MVAKGENTDITEESESREECKKRTNFAVYLCLSNRGHASSSDSDAEAAKSSEVDSGDKPIATKDVSSFSFSLLATDLNADTETELRCYLLKKMHKDLQDESEKIGVLEISLEENNGSPAMCFYHVFWQQADGSSKPADEETASKMIAHVVCFIAPDDGTLDLFYSDLEKFSIELMPPVRNSENEFPKALKDRLENWYSICVLYICRCVQRLASNIAVILHFALNEGSLDISISDPNYKEDLQRFMELCSIGSLQQEQMPSALEKPNASKLTIKATVKDGEIVLDKTECSKYCMNWAKLLLKGDANDPMVMRRIIEGFKVRTIQDMNTIKRIVKKAENDHYALFRAHNFLKGCGYTKTLFQRALSEGSVTSSPEGRDVMTLLLEFLPNDESVQ